MSNLCDFFNCGGGGVVLPNTASNELWVPVRYRKTGYNESYSIAATFNHGSNHVSYNNCVPTYYNNNTKELYFVQFTSQTSPYTSDDEMRFHAYLYKYRYLSNTTSFVAGITDWLYINSNDYIRYLNFTVLPCKKSDNTYAITGALCLQFYDNDDYTYYTQICGGDTSGNDDYQSLDGAYSVYIRYNYSLETFVAQLNTDYYKWNPDTSSWDTATSSDFTNAPELTGQPAYGNGSTINYYTNIPDNAQVIFRQSIFNGSDLWLSEPVVAFGSYAFKPLLNSVERNRSNLFYFYTSNKIIYCEDFIGYTHANSRDTAGDTYVSNGSYVFLDTHL